MTGVGRRPAGVPRSTLQGRTQTGGIPIGAGRMGDGSRDMAEHVQGQPGADRAVGRPGPAARMTGPAARPRPSVLIPPVTATDPAGQRAGPGPTVRQLRAPATRRTARRAVRCDRAAPAASARSPAPTAQPDRPGAATAPARVAPAPSPAHRPPARRPGSAAPAQRHELGPPDGPATERPPAERRSAHGTAGPDSRHPGAAAVADRHGSDAPTVGRHLPPRTRRPTARTVRRRPRCRPRRRRRAAPGDGCRAGSWPGTR